jgi:hypothetical protein
VRIVVALSLSFLLMANEADAATAQGNRMAYDATLKCAVANGLAEQDERDAGHAAGAAEYETKTHRSFDLAYVLGAKVGLTDQQVLHDLDAAREIELSRMMRDRSYYLSTVSTCKAMGLM